MKRSDFLNSLGALTLSSALQPLFGAESATPKKRLIIKADDVFGEHPKWEKFFHMSQEAGVKVSAGIVANSLQNQSPTSSYAQWVHRWIESGFVEFWNHGWDHKRWSVEGKNVSEFGGSGFVHQLKHLTQVQETGKRVLNLTFTTFGSPFNDMDDDTAKALNAIPELKTVFAYPNHASLPRLQNKIILPMNLEGEADGVGKPNFTKFKTRYDSLKPSSLNFTALQFHPAGFSDEGFKDYLSIVQYLKQDGWDFFFPSEITG